MTTSLSSEHFYLRKLATGNILRTTTPRRTLKTHLVWSLKMRFSGIKKILHQLLYNMKHIFFELHVISNRIQAGDQMLQWFRPSPWMNPNQKKIEFYFFAVFRCCMVDRRSVAQPISKLNLCKALESYFKNNWK